jgi:hypothetical protein
MNSWGWLLKTVIREEERDKYSQIYRTGICHWHTLTQIFTECYLDPIIFQQPVLVLEIMVFLRLKPSHLLGNGQCSITHTRSSFSWVGGVTDQPQVRDWRTGGKPKGTKTG